MCVGDWIVKQFNPITTFRIPTPMIEILPSIPPISINFMLIFFNVFFNVSVFVVLALGHLRVGTLDRIGL